VKIGDAVCATVIRVEPYGVYLQHGEHEILVLVPELSWQPMANPAEKFSAGDRVRVKLLRYDSGEAIFIGSVRAVSIKESPYLQLATMEPGTRLTARIYGIFDGAAIVELTNPLLLGKVPVDRIPPTCKAGDLVEVIASSVDVERSMAFFEIVTKIS